MILFLILFLYNIFFPVVFLFFLPGLIYKLIKRGGSKDTFWERFAVYSHAKIKKIKACRNKSIWVHAVSVGETQIAVDFIRRWKELHPESLFILSTTTTTGQELARNRAPKDTIVIFCPIDYFVFVIKVLRLIKPSAMVIFETEIWPNLITISNLMGIKTVQVNARISDHSFKGYKRFRMIISKFLSQLTLSCAQTEMDESRLKQISSKLNVEVTGNMKFDQSIPENISDVNIENVFQKYKESIIILAASTHKGEEKFLLEQYLKLKIIYPNLKIIIVPRHAERAAEIVSILKELNVSYFRRSNSERMGNEYDCLLADTTGEMLGFMKVSDIVIMGKSFASNSGGHNVIEPALLSKPIVTGTELTNFREILNIMKKDNAICSVKDEEVFGKLDALIASPELRNQLGIAAYDSVSNFKGSTDKTIEMIRKLLI